MPDDVKTTGTDTTKPDDTKTGADVKPDLSTVLDDTKTETKKEDVKAGDTKPDDKKTDDQQPAIPEKYELKLPEDNPFVTESDLKAIEKTAKARKLTAEQAQALVNEVASDRASFMDGQTQAFHATVKEWGESLKKDAEIAGKDGSEYEGNVAYARNALNKFGSPELKKALNQSGYGNHPEVVRLLVRIGKAMKEDTFHTDGKHQSGQGGDPIEKRAQKFYGQTQST